MIIDSNSIEYLCERLKQSIDILENGGFTLKRSRLNSDNCDKYLSIDNKNVVKTLTLIWQPEDDDFILLTILKIYC